MHIQKIMLFDKRFNGVSFLVCFLVSLSISFFAGYYPVLSLNPLPLVTTQVASSLTIADVVKTNKRFNILVKYLEETELMETLNSRQGSYTIFAPTDTAFTSSSHKPNDKETWKKILQYHILKGSINSQKLKSGKFDTLLEGDQVNIKVYSGSIKVNNNAKATELKTTLSNGVIYEIDKVIIPPHL
ncbi:MAG: fasciclin domain-containing protein [Nostoc sp. ChiQUE01b]|nr:fasciclin domain-containing protein [Nostoc sp. ChiQUE01b]